MNLKGCKRYKMSIGILVSDFFIGIEHDKKIKVYGENVKKMVTDHFKEFLDYAKSLNYPIFGTQYSTLPKDNINKIIIPYLDTPVIEKESTNAFAGTELEITLQDNNISEIFVIGYHRDECVYETIKAALLKGYDVSSCKELLLTSDKKFDYDEVRKFIEKRTNLINTIQESKDYLKKNIEI